LITPVDIMKIWHEMNYIYINLFTALYFLLKEKKKQEPKNGLACLFVETFIFFRYPTNICVYKDIDTPCLVKIIDIKIITY